MILFKKGSDIAVMINPKIKASREKIIASPVNCFINCQRVDPIVFLIPTSFARFVALAVDRLIKLNMAMSKTNKAIPKKIFT